MSRCFGNFGFEKSTKMFAAEKVEKPEAKAEVKTKTRANAKTAPDDLDRERYRQRIKNWHADFKTAKKYVEFKLEMLRNEMYIEPTEKEVAHLYELKTEGDIDRAVCSIISRHWD